MGDRRCWCQGAGKGSLRDSEQSQKEGNSSLREGLSLQFPQQLQDEWCVVGEVEGETVVAKGGPLS